MQKLMFISKNITKSAFALGLMLQAGYAMEEEKFEDEIGEGTANATKILKENFEMAQQIVALTEHQYLPPRNPNAPFPMRTGSSSVDQDYEQRQKEIVKGVVTLELTTRGMEFEATRLRNQLSEADKKAVDDFFSKLK